MADVKWIKITTDMFDNRKIKHLRKLPAGNDIVLIWVMLLTMAGRCNSGGMIYLTENIPYTPKMLADELGFEENVVVMALKALEELNMITMDSAHLTIPGWEEYQSVDGLDRIREQTRKRVQKHRERQKQLERNIIPIGENATEREKDKEINTPPISPMERFGEFASAYPKACASYLAETEYCNAVMSGVPESDLVAAAKNYADACRREKTAERYIKKPENFLRENLFVQYLAKGEKNGTDGQNAGRNTGTNQKSINDILSERGYTGEFEGF